MNERPSRRTEGNSSAGGGTHGSCAKDPSTLSSRTGTTDRRQSKAVNGKGQCNARQSVLPLTAVRMLQRVRRRYVKSKSVVRGLAPPESVRLSLCLLSGGDLSTRSQQSRAQRKPCACGCEWLKDPSERVRPVGPFSRWAYSTAALRLRSSRVRCNRTQCGRPGTTTSTGGSKRCGPERTRETAGRADGRGSQATATAARSREAASPE